MTGAEVGCEFLLRSGNTDAVRHVAVAEIAHEAVGPREFGDGIAGCRVRPPRYVDGRRRVAAPGEDHTIRKGRRLVLLLVAKNLLRVLAFVSPGNSDIDDNSHNANP